ncbi:MAG: siroheme synthase CysG [Pseudomonadota bacterium]|nr:siroheme synthase CysG [Pseudomonadota bacterium]
MGFYPVFLKLDAEPCTVVGGGAVAARKVDGLLKAGACVTVIAPQLNPALLALEAQGRIRWAVGDYSGQRLGTPSLVIAATDDEAVNRTVHDDCRARNIPVNVADAPHLCTFILPAVVDRSPVQIAISSAGTSPILTRRIKARLEAWLPARYGALGRFAERWRAQVRERVTDPADRRRWWEDTLDSPIAERVLDGRETEADALMDAALSGERPHRGEVYLVGAGPGDPDLLTFRALRLMQQADVVLYDRLVTPEILELVRKEAERIYVGKARSHHVVPQAQINAQLVALAREGKRVLRLKGGDPFIFGRGGEEIDQLAAQGIPFQVVPGITAAAGCASYAGIPLTHRDHAHSCVFLTGHPKDAALGVDWNTLTQPMQTLAIYMGLQGLESICASLIAHGLPPHHPAAVIQQGSTPAQRVVVSDLAHLAEAVRAAALKAPTLVIVGEVVRLREKLRWYGLENQSENAFTVPGTRA